MSRTVGVGNEAAPSTRYSSRDKGAAPRYGVPCLLAGVVLAGIMLLMGLVTKAGPVAWLDLRADQKIAQHRIGPVTVLARAISMAATPEIVGVGLMAGIPVLLLLARRRVDAIKAFCVFAGAFALAEAGKKLIGEHRPPVALQAMKADSGASYPSGHVTVAAALAVVLVIIAATLLGRFAATVFSGLYVVAVAISRVYLADHYPLDLAGSVLCALAAALIVIGLAALPAVQPYLRRLDRSAATAAPSRTRWMRRAPSATGKPGV